jgi:hypothetical protein
MRSTSYGVPSFRRRVINATRRPSRSPVARSLAGGSSRAGRSPFDCDLAPSQVPRRLRSSREPPDRADRLRMPICAANTAKSISMLSLSPDCEAEWLSPVPPDSKGMGQVLCWDRQGNGVATKNRVSAPALFVAASEELNFSHAIARSHLSQPPLSRQIRNLEEEIGAPQFDRLRRKRTDAHWKIIP